MKKKILFLAAFLGSTLCYGQGEMNALDYSRNQATGSARGMAMGGAFGALGGDATGIASNPAGIALYRSSEVMTTMNFSSTSVETNLQGSIMNESKFKFNFDNFSYVSYYPTGGDAVTSFNFGFAYNRVKNFDRNYRSKGQGLQGSLTDYIATITSNANIHPDDLSSYDKNGKYDSWPYEQGYPWLGVLGYNAGLVEYQEGSNPYDYRSPLKEGNVVDSRLNVSERGAIETYDFSGGLNISHLFYMGATVSITDLRYSLSSTHSEDFPGIGNRGFDLNNSLETEGSGFGFSLGGIFRPLNAIRLGAAYHSPRWYNMTDYFDAKAYPINMTGKKNAITPDRAYTDYKFQTPYRWVFSGAAILGTSAVLSVDYELTDYSGMKFKDRDGFAYSNNKFIESDFRMASTLKSGLELRLLPQVSVRAGYSWSQSPLTNDFKAGNIMEVITEGTIPHYILEGDVHSVSMGLGCKLTPQFYMDLAFVYRTQSDKLYSFSPMYGDDGVPLFSTASAKLKQETMRGLLSLGYKF
ncbi:hemin receptor [Bacteroidales bacterium]|nr:hemin receptor [Bacteroidales bacterium]